MQVLAAVGGLVLPDHDRQGPTGVPRRPFFATNTSYFVAGMGVAVWVVDFF